MWNKRKEEEYQPKPAATPSSPASVKENFPATPAAPMQSFHTPERGTAVIGKSVMIKGQIISREDLTVDGEVDGSLELHENRLTVGLHGKVQAGIRAREVIVLGLVQGNVEATERVEIRKEARVTGDLKTARIMIEDGAYFKGSIDIVNVKAAEKPAQPAKPAPPPAATAPAHTATATATTSAASATTDRR